MRRFLRPVWLLGLVVQVVGYPVVAFRTGVFGPSTYSVESMVNTEGPPPGSSPQQVAGWLKSKGVQDRPYEADLTLETGYPENATPAEVYGPHANHLGGVQVGIIPDAAILSLMGGEVVIYFFFDKDGRLVGHAVRGWAYYL